MCARPPRLANVYIAKETRLQLTHQLALGKPQIMWFMAFFGVFCRVKGGPRFIGIWLATYSGARKESVKRGLNTSSIKALSCGLSISKHLACTAKWKFVSKQTWPTVQQPLSVLQFRFTTLSTHCETREYIDVTVNDTTGLSLWP